MKILRTSGLMVILVLALIAFATVPSMAAKATPASSFDASQLPEGSTVHKSGDSHSVSFWQVPLPVKTDYLLACMIAFAGVVLGFPIIGKIKNMLENDNRKKIYEFIKANPGCTISEISSGLSINVGTADYHLFKLKCRHKIACIKTEKFVRLYASTLNDEKQRTIHPHLRNKVSRSLLLAILNNPGITNQSLSEVIKLHKSTVHWYQERFKKDGIIFEEKDGKYKRYFIHDDYKTMITL